MAERSRAARIGRAVLELSGWIAITIATLLVLEGGASAVLLVRDRKGDNPPKRLVRPRTMRDTLLGWRNDTSYANANEYGKGIAMTTTSAGLRATTSVATSAPAAGAATSAGLICSGDSFTFGVGVADDRTWCARLATEIPGLRTFDMAQESYGMDQAYLWYRRDGHLYPHQVQIFAVTSPSMVRTLSDRESGWFKPQLALDGDRVALRHVPVPVQTRDALEHAAFMRALDQVRLVEAFHRLPGLDPASRTAASVEAARPLFDALLGELAALHRTQRTKLVAVYLPTSQEAKPGRLDVRRRMLSDAAARRGITFIDLTPALRALPRDSVDLAFVSATSPLVTPRAAGQYSDLGNAWVARALAAALAPVLALPGPP